MKVKLSGGEGKFGIQYGFEPAPEHLKETYPQGLRSTTVTVVLPNGEELQGKVVCFSQDKFVKRVGRFGALRKIISEDNEQAFKRVTKLKVQMQRLSLQKEAQKYYKLSREDRRAIFQVICPEFYRNTPQRVLLREKAMYDRLTAKFSKVLVEN